MKSYADLKKEIDRLTKIAEKTKTSEFKMVRDDVRKKIRDYGLTMKDIGLSTFSNRKTVAKAARASNKTGAKAMRPRVPVAPKYKDTAGNTWTGRGKKPIWLVRELERGSALESFLISKSPNAE